MSWMKVHSQMFTAPKALSLTPHDRMLLLTVAFLHQESDVEGADDDEMAVALRIDTQECHRVKNVLVSKGLIDEAWNLKTDWVEPYETSARRVKAWREKKKAEGSENDVTLHSRYSNATVTECNKEEKIREEKKREEQTDAREREAPSAVVDSASLDSTAKGSSVTKALLLGEGYSESEIDRAILQVETSRNGTKISSYISYVRAVCNKNRVNPPPWIEEELPKVFLTERQKSRIAAARAEM